MSQNQITTSFILRSTAPNFERDAFINKNAMASVDPAWMDDGHISYCIEDGNHYIYRSKDLSGKELTGFNRWTQLTSLKDKTIISVATKSDLNAKLAVELPAGSLVFVKDELIYYSVVAPSEGSNWFRPLFNDVITREEFEEQQFLTKDDIDELDFVSNSTLSEYATLTDIQGLVKKQDLNGLVKSDQLEAYATKDSVKLQEYTLKEYVDNQGFATEKFVKDQGYLTPEAIDNAVSGLVSKEELEEEYATKAYIDDQGFIKEHQDISHLATKEELEGYVKQGDIPTIENAATKEDLEGYVKQEELTPIQNQLTSLNTVAGSIQTDLNEYKEDVAETYATKTNLNDYVKYTAFQDENRVTNSRIQEVEASATNLQTDLNEYKESVAETYSTKEELENQVSNFTEVTNTIKTDLDKFKEDVANTYIKPEDVSSKLNNYSPSIEHENRWIGADCAGDLAGHTGKDIANAAYSYSEVFDQMLFSKFIPTVSQPSVEIALKENWKNDLTIDWYDEKKRIILVETGTAGPDGGDFVAVNAKDATISYPKGIDLSTNYTNGLIPSTDEQQTSIGFCRVQDEDGNWVYYRKENNIYHVPATLEEGEYRYYMAAYFKEGSPAIDNDNMLVSKWNENTPVESEDYITFYVSKPSYSYTEEGFIKNPLQPWTDNMVDYMSCKPSCVLEQMFKTPRKLKELCIFNGIGGYTPVPMVYAKDEDGVLTDNLVPAYFTESVDEDGYYTYIYDSSTNGHRGEIKIKVIY